LLVCLGSDLFKRVPALWGLEEGFFEMHFEQGKHFFRLFPA